MCFSPSIPKDNSAEIAAQNEAKRQSNIKKGQATIDQSFNQFSPDYYSGITKNYENYYNPQLNQQYQEALNKLTYQLGQQGILQSTEAGHQQGLLKQAFDNQTQSVADQGLAAANTAKQQVANEKNQLYNLNNTAADPSLIASQAAQGASSAVSPITYSPLGNVFAGLLGQGTNALAVQQGGVINTGGYTTALPSGGGGGNTAAGVSGQSSGKGVVN